MIPIVEVSEESATIAIHKMQKEKRKITSYYKEPWRLVCNIDIIEYLR